MSRLNSSIVISESMQAALVSLLLFNPVHSVFAANRTWTGGGDGTTMSQAANWGGTAPSSGDMLFFAGTTGLKVNNDFSSLSNTGITFNSGAGAFVISGNTLSLAGGVTNNSTNTQTFYMGFNNLQTNIFCAAVGQIVISNVITPMGIAKMGTNKVTLANQANDANLGALVNEGALVLNGTIATALGSAPVQINSNGTLVVASALDQIHYDDRINVEPGGTFDVWSPREEIGSLSQSNLTGSGGVVLNNSGSNQLSELVVGGGFGHRAIFNGSIKDGTSRLSFTVSRSNTLQVFNGSNT